MKYSLIISAFGSLIVGTSHAFTAVRIHPPPAGTTPTTRVTALFAKEPNSNQPWINRRNVLATAAATVATSVLVASPPAMAQGEDAVVASEAALVVAEEEALGESTPPPRSSTKKVVVAGATGQSGRRVLEKLAATPGLTVVGAVRNVAKAEKSLQESSTVIRGAMIQKVGSIDTTGVQLVPLDIVKDSTNDMVELLKGAESLVIAIGFVPTNPLKMNQAAHEVDNVGTCHLIDAAKAAGIQKVVLISSILTNGRAWGQEKSPGFVVTNAFGNVLDEKLVAENYLKASGLDYTIVRAGGLKSKPPSGALIIAPEDTLNAGEVSRDLVADVCVASLTDPKASNKVLEIIEDDNKPPQVFNGLVM